MSLHSRALFAKPMLRVNKPLLKTLIEKPLVTWQNIPRHVIKYFSTSLQVFQVENEYTKSIP
jgi:hypothetical protein